ncbi:MAG: hypothetical protein N0A24_03590 [Armatimonadetes bacterium]|nr:hypothetical protein [Armatimonadota bacterium]MDW8153294.1 hypothetical protein [Armatimonadota bacterium]
MDANGRGVVEWVRLSLAAAATAGVLAVLITGGRLPLFAHGIPPEAFYKTLVGHVTFSLVVWLLGCSTAVALHLSCLRPPTSGLRLAALGFGCLLAGLALPGRPVVVDYLPFVASPLYWAGYLFLAFGVLLALAPLARAACPETPRWGARCLALAYGATLLGAVVGLLRVGGDHPQAALWGAGHALQFVYVTALALAWHALAEAGWRIAPTHRSPVRTAYALSGLLAFLPSLLYLAPDPSGMPDWSLKNAALGLGLSVPTLVHLWVLVQRIRSAPPAARWPS